jgi:hypothetical protein
MMGGSGGSMVNQQNPNFLSQSCSFTLDDLRAKKIQEMGAGQIDGRTNVIIKAPSNEYFALDMKDDQKKFECN